MSKNKQFKNSFALLGLIGAFLLLSETSFAHGYIQNSRVHLGHLGINENAGPAQYEPQSIEAIGNFPIEGPADGKIAGGGKYHELDEQTADRWKKISMNGGRNTFTWTLTAPHRTDEWKYYITKADWNPNAPLTRDDLELIHTIDENGEIPPSTVSHSFDLPVDRDGYHLILGVWEIEDTVNAFYQVMDIELNNDMTTPEDTEAPTAPGHLHSMGETSSTIDLHWNAATDNVAVDHYVIYRDGKPIATTDSTRFMDTDLTSNTAYSYTVIAVDAAGNSSTPSTLVISTSEVSTEETTWDASKVYNEGDVVIFEGIEYTARWWTQGDTPGVAEVWQVESGAILPWLSTKAYAAGDQVSFEGNIYVANWWSQGELPSSSSAWSLSK